MIGRRAVPVLIVCAAAIVATAVPAWAFFSAGGLGTASGASSTLSGLTILPATGSPSSALLPGGTGDLILQVTNTNPGPVTITAVSQSGAVRVVGGSGCTDDPAWPTSLGDSGVSVSGTTGLSIVVAGGATQEVHLSGAVSMSSASAAGCEGASFQIPIAVQVVSP